MQRLSLIAVLVASASFASTARAETCGRADLLAATPPDESEGVPTNALPSARYRSTAEYIDEPVLFAREGEEMVPVEPFFEAATGTLSFVPPVPLEANTAYVIEWPALRGIGNASQGNKATVHFRTGDGPDQQAPSFTGAQGVDWIPTRELDECTDRHEDRFEFTLDIGSAEDDSGNELLDVVVFQTKGPQMSADGGPRQVHVERYRGASVTFTRSLADAEGDVCFAAIVRDPTGQISASGSRETCTTTKLPPVFQGCSVGRTHGFVGHSGEGANETAWLSVTALGAGALTMRSRRRSRMVPAAPMQE